LLEGRRGAGPLISAPGATFGGILVRPTSPCLTRTQPLLSPLQLEYCQFFPNWIVSAWDAHFLEALLSQGFFSAALELLNCIRHVTVQLHQNNAGKLRRATNLKHNEIIESNALTSTLSGAEPLFDASHRLTTLLLRFRSDDWPPPSRWPPTGPLETFRSGCWRTQHRAVETFGTICSSRFLQRLRIEVRGIRRFPLFIH